MLTMGDRKKRIGVFPSAELGVRRSTFDRLAELFPVAFEAFDPASSSALDACIFLAAKHPEGTSSDVPCYVWERSPERLRLTSARVEFSSWQGLDRAIRGHCLTESTPREVDLLTVQSDEIVAAEIGGHPMWTVRGLTQRVAIEPPRLSEQEGLFTYLEAKRWLDLLPLLHFLRSVCKDILWEDPPLRACFVFDDPNLHAFTYGHLDFRRIAREAKEHNYHVVFATVPADGWYVNPEVARLFVEQSECLSLTVHGVGHTRDELKRTKRDGLSLLALGLRRLETFDQKSGLKISRVMVPPHEGWSNSITNSMLKLGYEGACVSTEHLPLNDQENSWRQHLSLGPVSWVGDGFPVLHRFAFAGPAAETGIRLAAFLGRSVIMKGHHRDCSSGADILRQRAEVLNELGTRWGSLKSIMRSNYGTRIAGDELQIRMCSRKIQIQIPNHVRSISIERPWLRDGDEEQLRCAGGNGWNLTLRSSRFSDSIGVPSGTDITLFAVPKKQIDHRSVPLHGTRAWAAVRRVLVEGRDRLQPLFRA